MAEVHRRLGLRPGKYDAMVRHLRRLEVAHEHLMVEVNGRSRPRRSKEWTDEEFRAAVTAAETVSDVARALGYQPNGGMHRWVAARIKKLGLDTSHFDQYAWTRRGCVRRRRSSVPLREHLVENSDYPSSKLRARLVAEGLKERVCEMCGLHEWRGRPVVLQLDHINGDHTDNRWENLRILCGNCHAQTPTWCKRNQTKSKRQTPA